RLSRIGASAGRRPPCGATSKIGTTPSQYVIHEGREDKKRNDIVRVYRVRPQEHRQGQRRKYCRAKVVISSLCSAPVAKCFTALTAPRMSSDGVACVSFCKQACKRLSEKRLAARSIASVSPSV